MKTSPLVRVALIFSILTASLFLGAVSAPAGAGSLRFVAPGPQDARVDATINTTDFAPGSSGFQVEVVDNSGNRQTSSKVEITISIDGTSPDAEPGAELSGDVTKKAVQGVATFSVSIALHGTYVLRATDGNSLDFGFSHPDGFRIWDEVAKCEGTGTCKTATLGDVKSDKLAEAYVSGKGTGLIAASFGDIAALDCPGDDSRFSHPPEDAVLTFFTSGLTGEKISVVTISAVHDRTQAQNGASFYQVCYQSDTPFDDRFGNEDVLLGYLPDCSPSVGPPCVQSRSKDRKGNVVVVVRHPEKDPNRW